MRLELGSYELLEILKWELQGRGLGSDTIGKGQVGGR